MSVLSSVELQEQLIVRELARRKMEYFVPFVTPNYSMGEVHRIICTTIDQVLLECQQRLSPRVIITLPPRHGKSTLASQKLPAFAFGRFPDMEIIGASYSTDLAGKMSREVQKTIAEPRYRILFPHIKLSRNGHNIQTIEEFTIPGYRGSYKAAGVGSGITGRGADLLIIDDPIKDMKEADSQLVRDNVYDWYYSTAYTRLSAGAGVIIIQTRWHPLKDDTPVLTTNGWKKHGDLQLGDYVFGSDGKPVKVLGSTPPVWCDMEIVTKEESIVCSKEHIWSTQSNPKNKPQLMEAQELYANGNKRFLPLIKPLEYPEANLIIDPYWLGLWLGNGSKTDPQIRCGKDFTAHCENTAYVVTRVYEDNKGNFVYHYAHQGLRDSLKEIGVFNNKHIPECYKRSSIEQRLQLLAGLLDSDGNANGNNYRFSNSNKILFDDVKELIISLGFNCSKDMLAFEKGTLSVDDHYSLCFQPDMEIPCKVTYKQLTPIKKQYRFVVAIKSNNEGWGRCIKTDAKDGIYLVGKTLIPTHNTNDLSGRLLNPENEYGDQFQLINFPAIAEEREYYPHSDKIFREEGDALDPERIPLSKLHQIRSTSPQRIWAALFQQRPVAKGGNIFQEDWIQVIEPDTYPKIMDRVIISCDMTFKDTDGTDFVVFQAWGQKGADFFLIDQVRDRMDFVTTCKRFTIFARKHSNAIAKLIEAKANGEAVISALKRRIAGLIPIEPHGSKEARAHAISPLFQAKNVFIPNSAWSRDFIEELMAFPHGTYDDQVDAMSQALFYLSGDALSAWVSERLLS